MVWIVLKNTNFVYGYFLPKFIPIQPCLGLRRNNSNLLGKCGRLVLLGFVPSTTKPLINFYGGIIWYVKHNNRPHTLNFIIINEFFHVTQLCTTLANF